MERGPYKNLQLAIAGELYGMYPRKVESWRAGEQIEFGVPVFSYAGDDFTEGLGSVYNAKQDTSTITEDADFVASNVITTTVTIDGVAQTPVATTWVDTHDNMMDAHLADLEAAITGLTVTLTDVTNNRQFTLFYEGGNINTVVSVVTAGATQAGTTIAYTTSQVYIGMSVITHKSNVDDVGYYVVNEAVNVLIDGYIYSLASVAVNANTAAYAIWKTTDQGYLTNVAADNYDTKMKFRSTISAAGLVVVQVFGQNTDATP